MSRALKPEEQERVRSVLRDLYEKKPNQRQLARDLGISQQHLSLVLSKGPVGPTIARKVADFLGLSFDELITGEQRTAPSRLSSQAAWEELRQRAQQRFPTIPVLYFDLVGHLALPISLSKVTAEWLGNLAFLLSQAVALEELEGIRASVRGALESPSEERIAELEEKMAARSASRRAAIDGLRRMADEIEQLDQTTDMGADASLVSLNKELGDKLGSARRLLAQESRQLADTVEKKRSEAPKTS